MNKEEKEVIKMIKTGLEVSVEGQIIEQIHLNRKEAQTVLNLIQKQEKLINKMLEKLVNIIRNDDNACLLPFYDYEENLENKLIEYFKKEVEKE